jgi:apolipoprotein N-acyltransferase
LDAGFQETIASVNRSLCRKSISRLKPNLDRNDWLSCLVSGALLACAFPPWEISCFIWIAFIPLCFRLSEHDAHTNAWLGFCAGLLYYGGTLYWLFHVTLPGMIILVIFHSLIFAFLFAMAGKFRRKRYGIPFLALAWALVEFLRGLGPFSFAWGFLGHALYSWIPLLQMTRWFGVPGLSFLVVMGNLSLAESIHFFYQRWRVSTVKSENTAGRKFVDGLSAHGNFAPAYLILTCCVLLFLQGYGIRIVRNTEILKKENGIPFRIALIQGNFAQEEKESLPPEDALAVMLHLSHQSLAEKPRLIIWPESSVTVPINYWPSLVKEIHDFAVDNSVHVLVGSVYGEYQADDAWNFYNRAYLFSPDQTIDFSVREADLAALPFYDKMHLVPYGEWIPLGRYRPFSFIETLIKEAGAGIFERGREQTIFTVDGDIRFAVAICFESTLAGPAAEARRQGADFIVNITNDAWFKRSAGLKQHFVQCVFRAAENQRFVLRAANTGITGVVNANGGMAKLIPAHAPGFCVVEIPLCRNPVARSRP